jgi:hypothetical protein
MDTNIFLFLLPIRMYAFCPITQELHEFLQATVPGDSLEYELIVHGNITETEVSEHLDNKDTNFIFDYVQL